MKFWTFRQLGWVFDIRTFRQVGLHLNMILTLFLISGIFGKVRSLMGRQDDTINFTKEELKNLERNGAWVCHNCSHVNSSIIDLDNCEKCEASR